MSERVDIAPKVGYLQILSSINYREWYAIAEFIDNSVQSYLEKRKSIRRFEKDYQLVIDIEIDSIDKVIIVRDNAGGIDQNNYQRAFRAAARPDNRDGLSEFGMGMKTAACWFSPKWEVITTAFGEDIEKTVQFDINKIVKDDITELDIFPRRVNSNKHYTIIKLNKVSKIPKGKTIGAIKTHLTEIYRHIIKNHNIKIYFKSSSSAKKELLVYEPPKIMTEPFYVDVEQGKHNPKKITWKVNLNIELDKRRSITGFAALREKGNTSQAGFSLFRRGRLIMGSGDEKYRPHKIFKNPNSFTYQRLFGDLEFHGFEVSHTKDGFIWSPSEEEKILQKLVNEINKPNKPLLLQAEKFRIKKNVPPKKKENQIAITDAVNKAPKAIEIISNINTNRISPIENKISVKSGSQTVKSDTIPYEGKKYKINIVADFDNDHEDWYRLAQKRDEIQIVMNMSHQFTIGYLGDVPEEQEGIYLLLMYMGLSEIILGENKGKKQPIGLMRHTLNRILRVQPPKYK